MYDTRINYIYRSIYTTWKTIVSQKKSLFGSCATQYPEVTNLNPSPTALPLFKKTIKNFKHFANKSKPPRNLSPELLTLLQN